MRRVLVRFRNILLLLLLKCTLLSHLSMSIRIPITTTKYDVEVELHRSLARYREYLVVQRKDSMRNLLQVDEKVVQSEWDHHDGYVNSTDPDRKNHLHEFQVLDQDLVDRPAEEKSNENPKLEKSEEQQLQPGEELTDLAKEKTPEKNVQDEFQVLDEDPLKRPAEENSTENPKLSGQPEEQQQGEELTVAKEETPEKHVQDEFQVLDQDPLNRPAEENLTENPKLSEQAEEQQKAEELTVAKEETPEKHVQDEFQVLDQDLVKKPAKEDSIFGNPKLEKSEEQQQQGEEELTGAKEEKTEENLKEEPFVFPEPHLLGPTIKDWDQQREVWLEQNPHMKSSISSDGGKPRVLIVTGSQPGPCRSPVGDYFHLQSLKLKIDYARMHNYEIYYNFAWLDPLFGGYWVKLPTVRKLMLTHPEIEWFLWIDSDAVFTDMLFEAPFDTYEGYNMIMWGWEQGVYANKLWTAFNAGVFIIRNCQWSLDLIDKWSPMGPNGPVRDEYGKILTAFLTGRAENYPADDQSALVYLMITDEAVKSKVKLVERHDYMISGWWVDTVRIFETSMEKYHPGLGDERWPWITHFTGCSPCGGDHSSTDYEKCMESFDKAYHFADNQVLAYMGFQHESLSSPALIPTRNETDRSPLEFVGVNPWEERIAQLQAAAARTSGDGSS